MNWVKFFESIVLILLIGGCSQSIPPRNAFLGLTEQQVISKLGKPDAVIAGKYTSTMHLINPPPCENCTTFAYTTNHGQLCVWFRDENGVRRCFGSETFPPY